MATFLILGGTGKVGRRLSRRLEQDGHTIRAVGRSTPLPFDWNSPATWEPATTGADGLFIVGPGSATDWSPRLTKLLETASGVRHAVLLSARGVEFLPDGNVARAEQALRTGPLPWTILRPTHFAQNFTEAMFTPVDGRIVAPVGGGAQPFVDVEDIAEVAARLLTSGAGKGETIEVSGPRAITFHDAARILAETTGRPIEFRDEGEAEHADALRAAGTPEEYIRWRLAMLGAIRRGDDAYLSDGVDRVLGRPATDFAAWAAREADDA
ncbi:hypothetical protein BWI15_11400 [Kribbella sp. ALI-6-A]|nr:hypothetical protein BWI15_11400 [Kribbella sp. ALI-6-A]